MMDIYVTDVVVLEGQLSATARGWCDGVSSIFFRSYPIVKQQAN